MAVAAFPAFHVTGAIHHYVTYPGQATALYLGTCETSPQVAFQELYKDVHNDVTGPSLPAQRIENGEMATMAIGKQPDLADDDGRARVHAARGVGAGCNDAQRASPGRPDAESRKNGGAARRARHHAADQR